MFLLNSVLVVVRDRLGELFGVGSPYGPACLGGALLFSFLFYADRRRVRRKRISVRGFVRSIFPARIIMHPSSLLDMRIWILNALVLASTYGLMAVSSVFWRGEVAGLLVWALGSHEPTLWPTLAILLLATFAQLLAYEFGYWFAHYMFHFFPALWEFHKVHHSAEVLTTFTEMRTHPVEIVAFMNMIGLMTGATFGVLTYAFGPGAQPFTLLNANLALMLFLLTIGHLRHSHMWLPFTGLLGKIVQSPAHHQVHHSTNPKHFDKNLGFALAIWDWAFGTLWVPEAHEEVTFGVTDGASDYNTVGKAFVLPFVRSATHIRRYFAQPVMVRKPVSTAATDPVLKA